MGHFHGGELAQRVVVVLPVFELADEGVRHLGLGGQVPGADAVQAAQAVVCAGDVQLLLLAVGVQVAFGFAVQVVAIEVDQGLLAQHDAVHVAGAVLQQA